MSVSIGGRRSPLQPGRGSCLFSAMHKMCPQTQNDKKPTGSRECKSGTFRNVLLEMPTGRRNETSRIGHFIFPYGQPPSDTGTYIFTERLLWRAGPRLQVAKTLIPQGSMLPKGQIPGGDPRATVLGFLFPE